MHPDKYEPDNVDATGRQNRLEIGSWQCHTFYAGTGTGSIIPAFTSCGDTKDILIFGTQGTPTISSLTLTVDPDNKCVDDVKIFYFKGGQRGGLAQNVVKSGFKFTIPCSELGANEFLVEITKSSSVTEGTYRIFLTASNPLKITGKNFFCPSQTSSLELTIPNLPQGATVSWYSTNFNITGNNDKCLVNNLVWNPGPNNPSVQATIKYNGCYETVFYDFTVMEVGKVPNGEIKSSLPCFPGSPTGYFSLTEYNPLYKYVWSAATGKIIKNTGDAITVDFSNITYSSGVVLDIYDPCGNWVATKSVYVPYNKCNGILGLTIFPNPVLDVINVSIADKTETPGGYKVFITDSGGTILYAEETEIKEFSIEAGKYQSGMYYFHIIKGEEHYVEPFAVGKF